MKEPCEVLIFFITSLLGELFRGNFFNFCNSEKILLGCVILYWKSTLKVTFGKIFYYVETFFMNLMLITYVQSHTMSFGNHSSMEQLEELSNRCSINLYLCRWRDRNCTQGVQGGKFFRFIFLSLTLTLLFSSYSQLPSIIL